MKNYASVIDEQGINILLLDFSGLSGEEFLKAISGAKDFCLSQPPGTAYPSITDLTGSTTNGKIRGALKEMGKVLEQRKPENITAKARAVVGLSGMERVIASAITAHVKFFETRKEAIAYIMKENAG